MNANETHMPENRNRIGGLLALIAIASILLCLALQHLEPSDFSSGTMSELISLITLN